MKVSASVRELEPQAPSADDADVLGTGPPIPPILGEGSRLCADKRRQVLGHARRGL